MASILDSMRGKAARLLSRFRIWHSYLAPIAGATLAGLRILCGNLFDTETEPRLVAPKPAAGHIDVGEACTIGGSYNNLVRL